MQLRHAPTNPIAAEEARRLGERDDGPLPLDDTVTFDAAAATLTAALGAKVEGHYHATDDGQWLNTRTGEVSATLPD